MIRQAPRPQTPLEVPYGEHAIALEPPRRQSFGWIFSLLDQEVLWYRGGFNKKDVAFKKNIAPHWPIAIRFCHPSGILGIRS